MNFLVGRNTKKDEELIKESERLTAIKSREYNEKMLSKLREWGAENGCIVEARLMPQQSLSSFSFHSTLYFRKMSLDELSQLAKDKKEKEEQKEE